VCVDLSTTQTNTVKGYSSRKRALFEGHYEKKCEEGCFKGGGALIFLYVRGRDVLRRSLGGGVFHSLVGGIERDVKFNQGFLIMSSIETMRGEVHKRGNAT